LKTGDFKSADAAAQQLIANAKDPKETAIAHDERGTVLLSEGMSKNKEEFYADADKEFKAALAAYPNFPMAYYADGLALARLKQDEAAKSQFEHYIAMTKEETADRGRARRYVERPELASRS